MNKEDLTGMQFGKLTAIKETTMKNKQGYSKWLCKCSCGNESYVVPNNLKTGNTKSCGKCIKVDLIGLVVGKLTVLRKLPIEERKVVGKENWLCQCECGNHCVRITSQLKNGKTKSCGCINDPDLVGKRFNRIVVIEKMLKVGKGLTRWKCQCDCGNITYATTRNLNKGYKQSCGCLSSRNLIGDTFGKLTVIGLTPKRDKRSAKIWHCKCECGNTIDVRTDSLTTGNTRSCGCITTSVGETLIRDYLNKHDISYEQEYKFNDLYDKNESYPLRFDFALFTSEGKLKQLIEFDGRQHFEENPFIIDSLEDIQRRDRLKDNYCLDKGIPLLRLNHLDYNRVWNILNENLV